MDFGAEWQHSDPAKKDHSQMGDLTAAFLAAETSTGRPAPPTIPSAAKISNSTDDFEHITHDDDDDDKNTFVDFDPLSAKKVSPLPPPTSSSSPQPTAAAFAAHFDDARKTPSPKPFFSNDVVVDETTTMSSGDLLDLIPDLDNTAEVKPILEQHFADLTRDVDLLGSISVKYDAPLPPMTKNLDFFAAPPSTKTPEPELLALSRTPEPEFEESSDTPEPDFFAPSKTPEPAYEEPRLITPEPPIKAAVEPEPVKRSEPEPIKPAPPTSLSPVKGTSKTEPMIAVEEIFYQFGLGEFSFL